MWIIRNGVNDEAQDGNTTDFNSFHHPDLKPDETLATANANGNGAVRFSVAAKTPVGGSTLVVKDGKFVGPVGSTEPKIGFTTAGYAPGKAEVYYTVVGEKANPDYSNYRLLEAAVSEGEWEKTITVGADLAGEEYYVYVIAYKDGEVSEPLCIETQGGGVEMNPIWGGEASTEYYVAAGGDDDDDGTKANPLATVRKALEKIASIYDEGNWPGMGEEEEVSAKIIIMDTVNVTEGITVDGNVGYPPIILTDDPDGDAVTLRTMSGRLLSLSNGARVTLEGNLILGIKGEKLDAISGVYISDSSFTMNGGRISGGWIEGYGAGVYIESGTFTMNNGEISDNSAEYGGGVYISALSRFIIKDGLISNNGASAGDGGGVYMAPGGGTPNSDSGMTGSFVITGGEISGNSNNDVYIGSGSTLYYRGGSVGSLSNAGYVTDRLE
jgi:hypothetical protein